MAWRAAAPSQTRPRLPPDFRSTRWRSQASFTRRPATILPLTTARAYAVTGQDGAFLPEPDLRFSATGQKVLEGVADLGRLCHADARATGWGQPELAFDLCHLRQALV